MINHKHKCIFLHVPKTGGTSIRDAVFGSNLRGNHMSWEQAKEAYTQYWDDYFKFTFVRNPWDRVYSIFSYYQMGMKITSVKNGVIPDNFKIFIGRHDEYLSRLGLAYNQTDFIGDEMDFIGRFENLNSDYFKICKRLSILNPRTLRGLKQSERKADYKTVYNKETIAVVESIFSRDIEKFEYTFK